MPLTRELRKPLRTYSRLKKRSFEDAEPPTKRRRVDSGLDSGKEEDTTPQILGETRVEVAETEISAATSYATTEPSAADAPATSSPAACVGVFSDEPLRSTPSSSPRALRSSPPAQTRRPIFSFMKRRHEPTSPPRDPLSEGSLNPQTSPKPRSKKKRLVQMQLDLVGDLRKTCKVCGMEYIPSNVEDAALHRKFHAMNVGGVDFTKAVVERLRQKQVWSGGNGALIAAVGRKDALALRNKASDVLKVVNTELAAVTITDEALWSQTTKPESKDPPSKGEDPDSTARAKGGSSGSDRFKVYLYIRSNKCIGACLAERITEAYTVEDDTDTTEPTSDAAPAPESSSISISIVAHPAILGISRIWTSNLHRKQGIATRLLDVARSDFLYGMTIEKEAVAFSQPTESGGRLARKWFGRRAGWHVYID